MKAILSLLLLASCGFNPNDCVYTEYRYLSELGTYYGKVIEVYDNGIVEDDLIKVHNTNNEINIIKTKYITKVSCDNFNKFKKD